jgi:hypothetical protein
MYPPWEESVGLFITDILSTIGERPSLLHSIDRIENSKGYVPGNLRWATKSEQSNNRDYVHRYTYQGKTGTIRDFSIWYGLSYIMLKKRLKKGMSIQQAIETPHRYHRHLLRKSS